MLINQVFVCSTMHVSSVFPQLQNSSRARWRNDTFMLLLLTFTMHRHDQALVSMGGVDIIGGSCYF